MFPLDAAVYAPGYTPEIAAPAAGLGLRSPADARVLVVASPGPLGTTVNLLAPVLVNEADGRPAQVVLDGQNCPVRAAVGAFE